MCCIDRLRPPPKADIQIQQKGVLVQAETIEEKIRNSFWTYYVIATISFLLVSGLLLLWSKEAVFVFNLVGFLLSQLFSIWGKRGVRKLLMLSFVSSLFVIIFISKEVL